ncbi:protein artemis-like isoform X2 [Leguminivora glycinivorella]|uniref:protein artemis-like isoform X2 n=1 Tax=Leguminivora glycinivorella TaxID=1035111 RepID=UPI00200C6213|nr:protein artemis-like isoform X2 [Leguminivora glycinivorella]
MACCAFNGHISEIPNISVDNFTNRNVQAYFLSHTHTDHTPGLYERRFIQTLKTNDAVMFMSEMSAAVVRYEVQCRLRDCDTEEIFKRIRIVGIETIEIQLNADPKRRQRATKLYVTAVPAAHSIGSVMFLFKTDFTTVLYTGDFRISINDVPKFNQLHDNGTPIPIDTLYVDTTFLDDRYTTFPKRSVSVDAALREMESWLKRNGRVAIKTSAKFGYEFVFNEVFKKLGVKVFVEEVRWKELYRMSANLDNPNFIRDRFKNEIYKPAMPTKFRERFNRPFAPAWMDYCDPYHCNDYHRAACGLNRRQRVFKWFQSFCHIILNNECAAFRGNLKYDLIAPQFCDAFVLHVRQGCRDCEPDGELVCAVSLVDNQVTLFRDRCALQSTNCEAKTFDEYEEVDMGLCEFYLKERALKISMGA